MAGGLPTHTEGRFLFVIPRLELGSIVSLIKATHAPFEDGGTETVADDAVAVRREVEPINRQILAKIAIGISKPASQINDFDANLRKCTNASSWWPRSRMSAFVIFCVS